MIALFYMSQPNVLMQKLLDCAIYEVLFTLGSVVVSLTILLFEKMHIDRGSVALVDKVTVQSCLVDVGSLPFLSTLSP